MGLAAVMAAAILVACGLVAGVYWACLNLAHVPPATRLRLAGVRRRLYQGGQRVMPGYYLQLSTGEPVVVRQGGGLLPGDSRRRYLRTPPIVVALAGPVVGGLYVLVLPVMTCGALVVALTVRMGRLLERWGVVTALARTLGAPHWMPGRAYLMDLAARRRPKGQTPTQDEEKTPLDRLESEIKERRRGGEQ